MSTLQFALPDFPHTVMNILEETALDPGMLELEITDSVLMHEIETAVRTLEHLKAIGVQLAIDDFGTGYSSLTGDSRRRGVA